MAVPSSTSTHATLAGSDREARGEPAVGREALRCLFKDGTITVSPGPDGVMVARSEILPFAVVMATDGKPENAKPA